MAGYWGKCGLHGGHWNLVGLSGSLWDSVGGLWDPKGISVNVYAPFFMIFNISFMQFIWVAT